MCERERVDGSGASLASNRTCGLPSSKMFKRSIDAETSWLKSAECDVRWAGLRAPKVLSLCCHSCHSCQQKRPRHVLIPEFVHFLVPWNHLFSSGSHFSLNHFLGERACYDPNHFFGSVHAMIFCFDFWTQDLLVGPSSACIRPFHANFALFPARGGNLPTWSCSSSAVQI